MDKFVEGKILIDGFGYYNSRCGLEPEGSS